MTTKNEPYGKLRSKIVLCLRRKMEVEIRAPHFKFQTYVVHTKVPNTIFNSQEPALGRTLIHQNKKTSIK